MAADSQGNDVGAVGIPVSGSLGFAPLGTALPTPSAGAAAGFTLPAAFRKAGLITEDGGFQWTLEPDGDPILFWQDGYSIPSGLANATLVAKLAQYDAVVRELSYGQVPDANGYIQIDAGGYAKKYVLFTEEVFKNGVVRRRIAGSAGVTGAVLDQSTRGEVNGLEVTFAIDRFAGLGNKHLGEWLIQPTVTA